MWSTEHTYRVIAEDRINRYRREAEEIRRAEQAGSRRSAKTPAMGLRDGIRRMFVHKYLLPLLASVRRP